MEIMDVELPTDNNQDIEHLEGIEKSIDAVFSNKNSKASSSKASSSSSSSSENSSSGSEDGNETDEPGSPMVVTKEMVTNSTRKKSKRNIRKKKRRHNSDDDEDYENDTKRMKRRMDIPITIPLLSRVRTEVNKMDKPTDYREKELLKLIIQQYEMNKLVNRIVEHFTFSIAFVAISFIFKRYYINSGDISKLLIKNISSFIDYRTSSEYKTLVQNLFDIKHLLTHEEVLSLTRIVILAMPQHTQRKKIKNEITAMIDKYKTSTSNGAGEDMILNEEIIFKNIISSIHNIANTCYSSVRDILDKYQKIIKQCHPNYDMHHQALLDFLSLLFAAWNIEQILRDAKKQKVKSQKDVTEVTEVTEVTDKDLRNYVSDFVEEINKLFSMVFANLNNTYPSSQRDLKESLKLSYGLRDNFLYYNYILKLKNHLLILKDRNILNIKTTNGIETKINVGNIFYLVFGDILRNIENELKLIFESNNTNYNDSYKKIKDNISQATYKMLSWIEAMIDAKIPNKFIFVILSYYSVVFGIVPKSLVSSEVSKFPISPLESQDTFQKFILKIKAKKEEIKSHLEEQLNEISIFNYHKLVNDGDHNFVLANSLIYKNRKFENDEEDDSVLHDSSSRFDLPATPDHEEEPMTPPPLDEPMTPKGV